MIRLQREPIDYAALVEQVRTPACGAVVLFLGTVRELTDGRATIAAGIPAAVSWSTASGPVIPCSHARSAASICSPAALRPSSVSSPGSVN